MAAQRTQALATLAAALRRQAAARSDALRRGAAPLATVGVGAPLHERVRRWCRDANAALLLRLCLDDAHLSALHASLAAAAALTDLMAPRPLPHVLARLRRAPLCWRGCEGGCAASAPPQAEEAGAAAESDAACFQRDALEGWVRAGVPARLRYVLETLHLEQRSLEPQAPRAAPAHRPV